MTTILGNGFGGIAAYDPLAAAKPVYVSGVVWFVCSTNGDDSNGGTDRQKPFATLDHAIGECSAGDAIVLMTGHAETVKDLAVPSGVLVIGEGATSGVPSVTLTPDDTTTIAAITLEGAAELRNVTFKAYPSANPYPVVKFVSEGSRLIGCRLELGGYNSGTAVLFGKTVVGCITTIYSHLCRIQDCTFVSTATSAALLPHNAIEPFTNVHPNGVVIDGCVFDDGTYGFGDSYAAQLGGFMNLCFFGCSLLNGADVNASGFTGLINPQTSTGGGTVIV